MAALPEIPATSFSLGEEGKECYGSVSHFQLLVRKVKQSEDGKKVKQIFCCLLVLMRGVVRCLCMSLDFAKPTDL